MSDCTLELPLFAAEFDPNDVRLPIKFRDRISVQELGYESACWVWTGGIERKGYGSFSMGWRKKERAHRTAYKALVGEIPATLVIDHLCRNHACVNPAHLEPVTIGVNVLRGEGISAKNAKKTHCKRGHPFEGDNLFIRQGVRTCRKCRDLSNGISNGKRRASL